MYLAVFIQSLSSCAEATISEYQFVEIARKLFHCLISMYVFKNLLKVKKKQNSCVKCTSQLGIISKSKTPVSISLCKNFLKGRN